MSKTYKVQGMTCDGCVRALTGALKQAFPGAQFEVSLERGEVRFDEDPDPKTVAEAVDDAGFDLAS